MIVEEAITRDRNGHTVGNCEVNHCIIRLITNA